MAKNCVENAIIAVGIYVCLSVCISASISQKPHVQTPGNFLFMLPTTLAQSCDDSVMLCYVLLVLCMMLCFSDNGASRAESKTTLCFVEFAGWWHRRESVLSRLPCFR